MQQPEEQSKTAPALFPHHSFWSEDYGPYIPSGSLKQAVKCDVAVIGAGFTGLSAAINLKERDAAVSVILLEQEAIGFGASGRNSGWVWPNLTTYHEILDKYGQSVLRETYQYAKQACDYVAELISTNDLDSDYRKTGLLRPAVGTEYEPDMFAYLSFCEKLGRSDRVQLLSADQVQAEVTAPIFGKGLWDEELALIQPIKHARALAGLARRIGVKLYEQTPVISIHEGGGKVSIMTPGGSIEADKVIIATNGFTHLLQGGLGRSLSRQQRPVFVYNTISRPLTNAEWSELGWKKRNAIYSFGPASHFGNPTTDGRIHWCSDRFFNIPYGNDMSCEWRANYNATLTEQTPYFFPALKDIELTHHWGGVISMTYDRIPHIGAVGQTGRVFLSIGCNGNGVSLTHLNGRILADLAMDRKTDLTSLWFVNHRQKKWPPAPISVTAMRLVAARELAKAKKRAISAGYTNLVSEHSED